MDHMFGKILLWRLSGFSPGTCEHQHDSHWEHIGPYVTEELIQQLFVIARLCDPSISTAQINLFHSGMLPKKGDFLVLHEMPLKCICLSAPYIQYILYIKDYPFCLNLSYSSYCSCVKFGHQQCLWSALSFDLILGSGYTVPGYHLVLPGAPMSESFSFRNSKWARAVTATATQKWKHGRTTFFSSPRFSFSRGGGGAGRDNPICYPPPPFPFLPILPPFTETRTPWLEDLVALT
jgi:hypothetical protein